MTSVKDYIWVNPFLDDFYDWGVGNWWDSKEQFLTILDTPNKAGSKLFDDNSTFIDGYYKFPQEIIEYLVGKVPDWYFNGLPKNSSGLPLVKVKHMSINGFNDSAYDNRDMSLFISAWENNTPFQTSVEFWPKEYLEKGLKQEAIVSYTDYPAELKNDNYMLLNHTYYSEYVKLLFLNGTYWNALFFTAKKNQSWCKTNKSTTFLNWTLRNPMEVKE